MGVPVSLTFAGVLIAAAALAQTSPAPPVRVGGNIPSPAQIQYVAPVYPEIAASAGVRGIVIVEASIDETGRVQNARVLRGIAMLDQAALEAVRQWEYEPTMLQGRAVPVIMTVTVEFPPPNLVQGSRQQYVASGPARGAVHGVTGGIAGGASGGITGGPSSVPPPGFSRSLTDEEAARDPLLIAAGRAGVVQLGLPVDTLFRRIPREQTRLVDLQAGGLFTPVIEILSAPGASKPSLLVRFGGGRRAVVSEIQVLDDRYRTATGLGVGSTYADIQAQTPAPRVIVRDEGVYAMTPELTFFLDWRAPAGSANTTPAVPLTARVTTVFVPRP